MLHLAWDGQTLFAWGEMPSGSRLHVGAVRGMPPLYPWAAAPDAVASAAGLRGAGRPGVRLLPLTLPRSAGEADEGPARYTVPTVPVPAGALHAVLWGTADASASGPRAEAARGFRPGADTRYWRRLARLALVFAARGGFLPGAPPETGGPTRWLPVPTPEERQAMADLACAMPADSLALVAPAPALQAADAFLTTCLDAWIRTCLAAGRSAWARPLRAASPGQYWLLSLINPVPLPQRLASPVAWEIARWTEGVLPGLRPTLGVVLRLEEPEIPEDGTAGGDSGSGTLRVPLTVLVQWTDAEGVPGAAVAATDLWREPSGPDPGERARRVALRRAAREALVAAARLWAPLADAVGEPPAALLALSVEEAEDLAERADDLGQQGVRVLMPAWWRAEPARVAATLHLEEAADASVTARGASAPEWTAFRWDVAVGGQHVPSEVFERMVAGRQTLVRLGAGWVRVDPSSLRAVADQWSETGAVGSVPAATALRLALEADPAAALGEGGAPSGGAVRVAASGRVADWLDGLRQPRRAEALAEPQGFRGVLRPYQRQGLGWLAFLAELGLGGCLADDMGLGKTVQVIALLLHRRATGQAAGPSLLVCPTSVVGNWQAELGRFAPGLAAHVHYGADRPRGERLGWLARQADVVVTSYALLHRDAADLRAVAWDGVILDEAQNVKNPVSLQAQAARGLPARYRFALTGTPVENSLRDLWSIFTFALPGYLGGGRAFTREYGAPVDRGDEGAAARLRRVIAPFVLRRAKRDPGVAEELPPKIEVRHDCALSAEQAALYEAFVREAMRGIAGAAGMARRAAVLTTLLRLKQICDHPSLFSGDGGELAGRSGKLERLEELLSVILAEGDRALIFTQFATWARRLTAYIGERLSCEALCLDGATPGAERAHLVRRFQEGEGPAVFVLSLKAGGTGLNLTAAQHVFHYDRWWNPAIEEQATDRAYRIGQQRSVQVHRLVVRGTLEERIDELLQRKAALARQVVGAGGEAWLTELSTDALREIFALGKEARK